MTATVYAVVSPTRGLRQLYQSEESAIECIDSIAQSLRDAVEEGTRGNAFHDWRIEPMRVLP